MKKGFASHFSESNCIVAETIMTDQKMKWLLAVALEGVEHHLRLLLQTEEYHDLQNHI